MQSSVASTARACGFKHAHTCGFNASTNTNEFLPGMVYSAIIRSVTHSPLFYYILLLSCIFAYMTKGSPQELSILLGSNLLAAVKYWHRSLLSQPTNQPRRPCVEETRRQVHMTWSWWGCSLNGTVITKKFSGAHTTKSHVCTPVIAIWPCI